MDFGEADASSVARQDGTSWFRSIMFPPGFEAARSDTDTQPGCFTDLNLDQIVTAIVGQRDGAVLRPFFYSRYTNVEVIRYRLAIFRDMDSPDVTSVLTAFCKNMRQVRLDLEYAGRVTAARHRQMVLLGAISLYCTTVSRLCEGLSSVRLRSLGLCALLRYLSTYVASDSFRTLHSETGRVSERLSTVRYGMMFRKDKVTVRRYADEGDYAELVSERFARFSEYAAPDIPVRRYDDYGLNHIEEVILEFVANLFPASFDPLDEYVIRNREFMDGTVVAVERELGFFLAYLEYIASFKTAGLDFCCPEVSATSREAAVVDGFDLALAQKLLSRKEGVVTNGFFMTGAERILLVSGPNQGGKTTFARMFGQLHYLAGLGCPVPARRAQLFLADQIYTHFERAEDVTRLLSKLEEELLRLRDTCDAITDKSVVILNEVFSSTSLEDQIQLSRKILANLLRKEVIGVCVSFIDVLASLDPKIVSMVTATSPEDPARRTFRIERRPADGLAYALSLAQKHGVTYVRLRARIQP